MWFMVVMILRRRRYHTRADAMVDVVLRAYDDLKQYDCLTRPNLSIIDNSLPFDDNVLYAVLHEACYLQGLLFCLLSTCHMKLSLTYQTGKHLGGPPIVSCKVCHASN